MKKTKTKKITFTALFIAMGVVLPILFHQIPNGWVFLPMHLPVLIAGLFAGPMSGFLTGLLTPLISSLLTSMPPVDKLFVMCTELAAYGFFAGYFQSKIQKNYLGTLVSLIAAMLVGRVVYGLASYVNIKLFIGGDFGFQMFLAGAFIKVFMGIIVQVVFVPLIVIALRKAFGENYIA